MVISDEIYPFDSLVASDRYEQYIIKDIPNILRDPNTENQSSWTMM